MVRQNEPTGYQYIEVCYQCNNAHGTAVNAIVWIKQKIDCTTALDTDTNGTSKFNNYKYSPSGSELEPITYSSSSSGGPTHVATDYTTPSLMFLNRNEVDCGTFQTCVLKDPDCSAAYSANGYALMNSNTFAITIRQDIQNGYTEDLCVKCSNSVGS